MSDGIIDLTQYLPKKDEEQEGESRSGTFALWGADGERSRFALPLWRSIYLAGGERGAIVRLPLVGRRRLDPFVVLDLASDPPRTDFDVALVEGLGGGEAPGVRDAAGEGLSVYLGVGDDAEWFLVVAERQGEDELGVGPREDILFMCGECAGLLFLRDFAAGGESGSGDPTEG